MTEVAKPKVIKGGEFLVKESTPKDIFIPEEFNEEQKMIREMAKDFMENEIFTNIQKIEKQENYIAATILEKAGELGLLGAHMPMDFGGMEMDNNSVTLIGETLGPSGSWIVAFAAHTGIGMLPVLYFGTDEQKQKYLPGLISGQIKSAYALTEPGSGSDALAAKTRADLSDDGKFYILNGQKMWISNAGFADLFIVFAQVDGDKFTGFLVDKGTAGMTLGAEENKLGIKGSSTKQIFFENAKVPVENVLGQIGKGHKIAFNVLNNGRFKLGVMSVGGAKLTTDISVKYANEREQFKQSIGNFGAIKYKLGEMAIRSFAAESAMYRVSQLMQDKKESLLQEGATYAEAKLKSAEEFAIECAIIKVLGSEVVDYVVDENVQIHGGMGFSEEGTAARAYRDARINRIYEGTNEINRLLTVDMLLKRSMKGRLDIIGPAWAVQKELTSIPSFAKPEGKYGYEKKAVKDFKKIILMVAGAAAKMQMDGELDLRNEQEVLMNVADMMIDTFTAESLLLRVEKLENMEKNIDQEVYEAILKTFFMDANDRMRKNATDALVSFAEGDLLKTFLMGLKRFVKYPPVNVKKTRRLVADTMLKADKYCF